MLKKSRRMPLKEFVARSIARTVLTEKGKSAFDADPNYYRRDFSVSERQDFRECAVAAIEAMRRYKQKGPTDA